MSVPGIDGATAAPIPVAIPPGVVPAAVYRKAVWRLIPLLFILYIASFLDRVNLNHAELPFSHDLGLDKSQYGFGAGLFFVGYLLSQVPSNMILVRLGPRRWIACIMVAWGLISGAMAFATDKNSFYALRFLLGFAEAGFFPGMLLYLSYWFPSTMRAQMVGRFMTAIAVAQVVGSSLSSQLMKLDGVAGLHGWQWLFLIEALPSILLTVVVLKAMVNKPSEAPWLTRDESAWLDAELTADRARVAAVGRHDLRAAFTEPRVYLLMIVYTADCLANYGTTFSITSLIQGSGKFDQITAILAHRHPLHPGDRGDDRGRPQQRPHAQPARARHRPLPGRRSGLPGRDPVHDHAGAVHHLRVHRHRRGLLRPRPLLGAARHLPRRSRRRRRHRGHQLGRQPRRLPGHLPEGQLLADHVVHHRRRRPDARRPGDHVPAPAEAGWGAVTLRPPPESW